ADLLQLLAGRSEDGAVGEQVAIEMADDLDAPEAAMRHRLKELADQAGEDLGPVVAVLDQPGEGLVGKEVHVLGEQGEDDAVEETGRESRPRARMVWAMAAMRLAASWVMASR